MDPADVDEALLAYGTAYSPDDLEDALDRVPALSGPLMQAIIRQQYLRRDHDGSPQQAYLEVRFWTFFFLLHERWHREIVAAAKVDYQASAGSRNAAGARAVPFMPAFWAALHDSLGGRVPSESGPSCDPAQGTDGLREELHRLCGGEITLPAYAAAKGASWGAVIVRCAACDRPRLDVRAFKVDLVVVPELAGPLRQGRINNAACPACGEACAYPIRVLATERPGPEDPLAALSCVWRFAPDAFCYQPPPGTARVEDKDRVLEVRFDQLFRALSWPESPGRVAPAGWKQTTMSVAYSPTELIGQLDRVTGEQRAAYDMEAMIQDLSRKVESGLLPLYAGIDFAAKWVPEIGKDWTLIVPGPAREWQGSPFTHLFSCLVAEGVAQARGVPRETMAVCAALTASSLLAMSEGALAEAALARADDHMARAAQEQAAEFWPVLADIRADLLQFQGRYQEAMAIRAELPELPSDDFSARAGVLGHEGNQGINLFGQGWLAEALTVHRQCIADWETLLNEVKTGENGQPVSADKVMTVCHGLSGALANLAAVLTQLADDLDLLAIVDNAGDNAAGRDGLNQVPEPLVTAVTARAEPALPVLAAMLPDNAEIHPNGLRKVAEGFLRHALGLSSEAQSWNYAGVQAHRLALLKYGEGDMDEAEEFARQAVEYASLAGDHERVCGALALLIEAELKRGDGPRAIEYLEACARHRMRLEVGRGHRAELLEAADELAVAAFQAVEAGGDSLRAIMIVESMRAAHTAASLASGTPYQLGDAAVAEPLAQILAERERLRLYVTWNPDDTAARSQLRNVEADLDRARTAAALRDSRFSQWVDATGVDLATPDGMVRRLAELGQDAVWLGVLATGDSLWTWVVDARGAAAVASRPRPQGWNGGGSGSAPDDGAWSETVLAGLAGAVLAPHARIMAPPAVGPLIVSVAGPLSLVPFGALPWEGRRLCEYAEIITVQGFGMFEVALARPRIRLESYALIGAPKRPDTDPLPGADRELAAISALLTEAGHEAHVFRGSAATARALIEAASSHDVIHIACHADVGASETRVAQLKLSLDMVRSDSGDVSEDLIATGITLRPGAMVDVAACSTAVTRDEGGPLLGGIVPAFLLAGAGCVIASLWPIADAPAAAFQLELYRQLVSGARPATALAATQRRCLRGHLGDHMRAPAIWAAYVAYGGR
jgi:tetratricopeptide (TPR) repeat protein